MNLSVRIPQDKKSSESRLSFHPALLVYAYLVDGCRLRLTVPIELLTQQARALIATLKGPEYYKPRVEKQTPPNTPVKSLHEI